PRPGREWGLQRMGAAAHAGACPLGHAHAHAEQQIEGTNVYRYKLSMCSPRSNSSAPVARRPRVAHRLAGGRAAGPDKALEEVGAMDLIALRDIRKTYHLGEVDVPVLQGIFLNVAHGELVALMGASGSGKSTLMHLLGCLDRPTSGEYWLN